ncbi:TIR domain-containing protein [Dolichospermum circinale]|uniref:TIR domain-containing protein n=1 Tax=Dolichospermum circinale TaxID=109265 RepID=UPI00233026DE|nr:TIR domain-containing protein [Dolichospermum circinale]MDB9454024.1 TIR domain-containing protein [Dolichospermum circinale CS-541/06]MDB9463199.1 TIR domain-containing protein [Dolichospermum circinale CS-541/04]MDB9549004.1 TIR domain-containing protein [Dolichospermum circinale CS-1031]
MIKQYRLFISHSWTYSDAYEKLINILDSQNLSYYNHSVPRSDPIHTNGTDRDLYEAIKNKIAGTSCVLIFAGVYSTYSKWINKEIEISKAFGKPIIAIEPRGAEKTSTIVKNNADIIVKWQGASIVKAIKELG